MFAYIVRRIGYSLTVLFIVSVIIFGLMTYAGDPLARLRQNPRVTPQDIARLEHQMGLDQPRHVQYWMWIRDTVRGEGKWQESFDYKVPVIGLIWDRFLNTLLLIGISALVALSLAVPIGTYSAIKRYSKFDYAATLFAFFGFSMPIFFFALILQLVLGFYLKEWLDLREPIFYTASMFSGTGEPFDLMDRIRHLILPVMTLSLAIIAAWSRYQRSAMLDVIGSDYLRTARAKGLSEWKVITKHAMKNALGPLVTVVAIDFAALLGGAVVTETIFAWPGMGRLFYNAVIGRDFPLVMGWVMFTSILVIVFNLAADIAYGVLDPRVRYE